MTKMHRDLESIKHPSIIRIAKHLISCGEADKLIKLTHDKPNKSLEEMYKYVTSEARKLAENGSAMIEDETVFGWAQHYYDEDSIVMNKPQKVEKSSKPKVEEVVLPEEDIDVFDF